ncbi:hypothetical protein DMENIID0001_169180 [Sergentomyia squamirostris]
MSEQRSNFPLGVDEWRNLPPPRAPNCPPGLEYLTQIDQLLVHQKVELLEAFTGYESNNRYWIKNSMGQKIFWAIEDDDSCDRFCYGRLRPFNLRIFTPDENQVIHFFRDLKCQGCCLPCCLQTMEVSSPPGNLIGMVNQELSFLTPHFTVKDPTGRTVFRISVPCCLASMCGGDVDFRILTMDGQVVGKISKQWSGLARELFTDADHFGVNFPMDLDVRMKAVLLGACFLIDLLFFEKT